MAEGDLHSFIAKDFLGGIHQEIHPEDVDDNMVTDWTNVIIHNGRVRNDRKFGTFLEQIPSGYLPIKLLSFRYAGVQDHVLIAFCNYGSGATAGRILYWYPLFATDGASPPTTLGSNWGVISTNLPTFYLTQIVVGSWSRFNYTDANGSPRIETPSVAIARLLFCQSYDGSLYELVFDRSADPHTATVQKYIDISGFDIAGFTFWKDRLLLFGENFEWNKISWSNADSIRTDTPASKSFNEDGNIYRERLTRIRDLSIWDDKLIVLADNGVEVGEYVGQTNYLVRYRPDTEEQMAAYDVYNDFELKPKVNPSLTCWTKYGIAILTMSGIKIFPDTKQTITIPPVFGENFFGPDIPTKHGSNRVIFKQLAYHDKLDELWALYYEYTPEAFQISPQADITQTLSLYLSDFETLQESRETTYWSEASSRASTRSASHSTQKTACDNLVSYWDTADVDADNLYPNDPGSIYSNLYSMSGPGIPSGSYTYLMYVNDWNEWVGGTVYNTIRTFGAYYKDYNSDILAMYNAADEIKNYLSAETPSSDTIIRNVQIAYLQQRVALIYDNFQSVVSKAQFQSESSTLGGYITNLASQPYLEKPDASPTSWDINTQGWFQETEQADPGVDEWSKTHSTYGTCSASSYGGIFADSQTTYRSQFIIEQAAREQRLENAASEDPRTTVPDEDFTNLDSVGVIRYSFQSRTWYKNEVEPVGDQIMDLAFIHQDFLGSVRSSLGAISSEIYPSIVVVSDDRNLYNMQDFDNTYAQGSFFQTKFFTIAGAEITTDLVQVDAETHTYWLYYRTYLTNGWTLLTQGNSSGSYGMNATGKGIQLWIGYNQSENPPSSAVEFNIRRIKINVTENASW